MTGAAVGQKAPSGTLTRYYQLRDGSRGFCSFLSCPLIKQQTSRYYKAQVGDGSLDNFFWLFNYKIENSFIYDKEYLPCFVYDKE